jgi:hypothetical protein
VQCTHMAKKPFTTRIDDAVLVLAQRVAEIERRSVTSVIEVALLEYAERHGFEAARQQPAEARAP